MKILKKALSEKAQAERESAIKALAKKTLAERVAKRRSDENEALLADEADWNRRQSKQILREVEQVGSWEAWEALEKKREQSILDAPPPDESPLSLDEMLEIRGPEPPEEEEPSFDEQEAEQIRAEANKAGSWEAWGALEKKRKQNSPDDPSSDGDFLPLEELLDKSEPEPPEKGRPGT